MAATHNIVDLRRMLAERFPAAHQPRRGGARQGLATGVPGLDGLLGGGLPVGAVTELVGEGAGSGSAQVIQAVVEWTAAEGRFLALVDGADGFDVDAATPESLARLLWVRCHTAEQALKATDLILRDGNLSLVILDLKLNPVSQLRKITPSAWHRLERLAEHHGAALLAVTPFALVGALTVRVESRSSLGIETLACPPSEVLRRLRFELLRSSMFDAERRQVRQR